MKKIALISDIHSNLEALEAVLSDIEQQEDVASIYCLGDLVGYGPDPETVVDRVSERCEFSLLGNHDFALTNAPLGFGGMAARAIEWQQERMRPGPDAAKVERERWDYLTRLSEQKTIDDNLFVHASPRQPVTEYLLPGDVARDPVKLEMALELVSVHCFVGHTHMPGVFIPGPKFFSTVDLSNEYAFNHKEKVIVNVSSVGQPRDRDPRACYALLTAEGVVWRRVEYDIETTVAKIKAFDGLDDRCGERLLEGR